MGILPIGIFLAFFLRDAARGQKADQEKQEPKKGMRRDRTVLPCRARRDTITMQHYIAYKLEDALLAEAVSRDRRATSGRTASRPH